MLNLFKKGNNKEKQAESSKELPENNSSFKLSLKNFKQVLAQTGETLVHSMSKLVGEKDKIDESLFQDIEESLIKADVGINTTESILTTLRKSKTTNPKELVNLIKATFKEIMTSIPKVPSLHFVEDQLNIYLIVGVNGSGKTTLIGKLAHRYNTLGKKVLIAAGDTFRAAAEDQLEIWAERAGVHIIRKDNATPATVIYEAISKAKQEKYDLLLIDTAGRLQNKFHLMQELEKVKKIIDKEGGNALQETILVLDATIGQNSLTQAKSFLESTNVTSIAINKLDGSAKGGIILAIYKDLKIPVKLVGVGEAITDLKDFDPETFINALFDQEE